MFCPKCGEEMVVREGTYYCAAGEMSLTQALTKKLAAVIEATPFEPLSDPTDTSEYGAFGQWYCPRCSKRLLDHLGLMEKVCPQCSLTLQSGIVFALVEHHPHRDDRGGWR